MSNPAVTETMAYLQFMASRRPRVEATWVELHNDGSRELLQVREDPQKLEAEREAATMVLDLIREHRPEWLAA